MFRRGCLLALGSLAVLGHFAHAGRYLYGSRHGKPFAALLPSDSVTGETAQRPCFDRMRVP